MHGAMLYRGESWLNITWPEMGTRGRIVRVMTGRIQPSPATRGREVLIDRFDNPASAAQRAELLIEGYICVGWSREIELQGPAVTVEPVDTEEESTSSLSSIDLLGAGQARVTIEDDGEEETSSSSSKSPSLLGPTSDDLVAHVMDLSVRTDGVTVRCRTELIGPPVQIGATVSLGVTRGQLRISNPGPAMAGFYGRFRVRSMEWNAASVSPLWTIELTSLDAGRANFEGHPLISGSGLASVTQQQREGSVLAESRMSSSRNLQHISLEELVQQTEGVSQANLWDYLGERYPNANERRRLIGLLNARRQDIIETAERQRRIRDLLAEESEQAAIADAERVLRVAAEHAAARGDFTKSIRKISLENE